MRHRPRPGLVLAGLVAAVCSVAVACDALPIGSSADRQLITQGPPIEAVTGESASGLVEVSPVAAVEVRPPVSPDLEQRIRSAVHELRSSGCGYDQQGTVSAVQIEGRRVSLTNAHVVSGSSSAGVLGTDGSTRTVPVSGVVRGRDVAVLGSEFVASALPVAGTPSVGQDVVVAGYPDGVFLATAGRVVSIESRVDEGGDVTVFLVDVPAGAGISGGIVVDLAGQALGLIAARDPETGNAVAYPFAALAATASSGEPASLVETTSLSERLEPGAPSC